MTLRLVPLVILLGAPLTASAQDCSSFAAFREGTSMTYTGLDAKGKETGSTTTVTTAVAPADGGLRAELRSDSVNAKGKPIGTVEYAATCAGGRVDLDMKAFVSPEQTSAYEGWTMSTEGNELVYPSDLAAGQSLPDGSVVVTMTMQGAPAGMPAGMTTTRMEVHLLHRQVQAAEQVTVPAGTFDAFRITYTSEVLISGMMKMTTETAGTEWYVPGLGAVKTESTKDGKLQGSSVLSAMSTR